MSTFSIALGSGAFHQGAQQAVARAQELEREPVPAAAKGPERELHRQRALREQLETLQRAASNRFAWGIQIVNLGVLALLLALLLLPSQDGTVRPLDQLGGVNAWLAGVLVTVEVLVVSLGWWDYRQVRRDLTRGIERCAEFQFRQARQLVAQAVVRTPIGPGDTRHLTAGDAAWGIATWLLHRHGDDWPDARGLRALAEITRSVKPPGFSDWGFQQRKKVILADLECARAGGLLLWWNATLAWLSGRLGGEEREAAEAAWADVGERLRKERERPRPTEPWRAGRRDNPVDLGPLAPSLSRQTELLAKAPDAGSDAAQELVYLYVQRATSEERRVSRQLKADLRTLLLRTARGMENEYLRYLFLWHCQALAPSRILTPDIDGVVLDVGREVLTDVRNLGPNRPTRVLSWLVR